MAGEWFTVNEQVRHLVSVEQIHYFDSTEWVVPGTIPMRSDANPTLEVVVGANGSTEWFARERVECTQYAVVEGRLFIRPIHRPLLTIWVGAANPMKERKEC